ncbi:tetratricopeptide repeat protein [Candidatus Sumerlaeota bacterium]|nr:tetratricopeptide repeat protein [Candidatus Sumerlaeota bacterium]
MKAISITASVAALLLAVGHAGAQDATPPAASSAPAPANKEKPQEQIGFTWWNDIPEMIRRGNKEYDGKSYKDAEDFYREAQTRNPDAAAAAFNIGLSEARQGNHDGAAAEFNRALNLAGTDAHLRAKTLYNLGSTHLNDALKLLNPQPAQGQQAAPQNLSQKDREAAIQAALSSIDAYNGALKLAPNDEAAKFNKAQAQHLLEFAAQPPPKQQDEQQNQQNQDPNQQEQQNQDQNKGDQPQEPKPKPEDPQDQKDQQQPKPDQNDQNQKQQDASQDPNKKDDSQQGNQQDEQNKQNQGQQDKKEPQPQPEDQQPNGANSQDKPAELSEEQARELLNLLGDQQNIVLRKGGHPYNRPDPKKDW